MRVGRDFTGQNYQTGVGQRLSSYAGAGVLFENRIQNRIGNLVGDLVGVAF